MLEQQLRQPFPNFRRCPSEIQVRLDRLKVMAIAVNAILNGSGKLLIQASSFLRERSGP
jgi:hypothetical protein